LRIGAASRRGRRRASGLERFRASRKTGIDLRALGGLEAREERGEGSAPAILRGLPPGEKARTLDARLGWRTARVILDWGR